MLRHGPDLQGGHSILTKLQVVASEKKMPLLGLFGEFFR